VSEAPKYGIFNKNTKKFLGRGTAPFPDPSPSGEGILRHLDPSHSKILGTPLGDVPVGSTITATNYDDQLGKIYPTTLNELNLHLAFVSHVFIAVAVMI